MILGKEPPISEISKNQWGHLKRWLILLIIAEGGMLIFNRHLPIIYFAIAILFFTGFLLRLFKLYSGKNEPLVLNVSSILISCTFAFVSTQLGDSLWRFCLIFTSSAIMFPNLLYIYQQK